MATSQVFRSTDTGAPVLTGQVGSLVNLLTVILLGGYPGAPGAGWASPFTGTNQAAFQATTSSAYLYVDDTGPGGGGATEARLWGYETMTGVGAGTNPFPNAGARPNGVFCRKSASADATPRRWVAVASATTFWLFVDTGDYANLAMGIGFGNFVSEQSPESYPSFICGRATEVSASVSGANESINYFGSFYGAPDNNGTALQRTYNGSSTGVFAEKVVDSALQNYNSQSGVSGEFGPSRANGGAGYGPILLTEAIGTFRGTLPGIWAPTSIAWCGHHQTFNDLAMSRTMEALFCGSNGQIYLETSKTWG